MFEHKVEFDVCVEENNLIVYNAAEMRNIYNCFVRYSNPNTNQLNGTARCPFLC